jgi:hypothetical protein
MAWQPKHSWVATLTGTSWAKPLPIITAQTTTLVALKDFIKAASCRSGFCGRILLRRHFKIKIGACDTAVPIMSPRDLVRLGQIVRKDIKDDC